MVVVEAVVAVVVVKGERQRWEKGVESGIMVTGMGDTLI